MAVFTDAEQFLSAIEALFARMVSDQAVAGPLVATRMIVRFRYSEPAAVLTFDFRASPPASRRDAEGPADVELSQSMDDAHQFWLGRLSAVRGIATGRIKARGDVARALALLPAIRPAYRLYPEVLRAAGLASTIPVETVRPTPRRRSFWQRFLRSRRRPSLDARRLPRDSRPPSSRPERTPRGAPVPPGARRTDLLRTMIRIREFEERLARCFEEGELPTAAIHLSSGQEAVATGVCAALRPSDCIASTHRGHGHLLAKGAEAQAMMAEIFGKATGSCRGRGGSMHVTDALVGALGANGIVGSSPLLATGAALALVARREECVAVAFLGDGATNQGMFHEALNLAAVWNLPVLFVVENNQYGEFTPQRASARVDRLAERAAAYGIPGERVDGNDVEAVIVAAVRMVRMLRAAGGPALLECLTYRYRGHMEGDLQRYRTAAEVEAWKARDPIRIARDRLEAEGLLFPGEADEWTAAAREEMERAVAAARAAPDPDQEEIAVDVFAPESAAPAAQDPPAGATQVMTGAAAINLALAEEMTRDETVVLLGEDVSVGGYLAVTAGLVDRFGRGRVRDTPISENAIVGGAVGAALCGLRPVAEILFSDFLTTCLDPLVNQAAKLRYMSGGQYRVPLVVRTPGGVGLGMAAQHSQSLESLLMGVPGLVVAAPSTPRDCRALLKAAIRSDNPVVFFEHKLCYLVEGEVPAGDEVLPFGRAAIRRAGRDLTIVALLYTVHLALEAAGTLAGEGIEAEVIDLRTLAPLDAETVLESVSRTRRLVTVEEGPVRHGWGAEVVARVAQAAHGVLVAPPERLGAGDHPIPYGRAAEAMAVPDAARIAAAARALLA